MYGSAWAFVITAANVKSYSLHSPPNSVRELFNTSQRTSPRLGTTPVEHHLAYFYGAGLFSSVKRRARGTFSMNTFRDGIV